MKSESNWEFGWYENPDKSGILELNQSEYGNVALSQEAYFDWLYKKNPMGTPIIPVAREKGTGKIVGFAMLVPGRVFWSDEDRPVLLGHNLLVARSHQRQGIFTAMFTAGLEEGKRRGFHFWYTFPNKKSLQGHIKLNIPIVIQIPLVVSPLNFGALTKTHVQNIFLRVGVNIGWGIMERVLWRERPISYTNSGFTIIEDDEFDEGYERFWNRVKRKYSVILVRDRTFLRWRYRENPSRHYVVLSARQGRDILGYIVLRQATIRGSLTGLIADFMTLPGAIGNKAGRHLLHEALHRFMQSKLHLSGGLMFPHSQEYALMQQVGYLHVPKRFAPQEFHLIVQPLAEDIQLDSLSQPERWYLTCADHDAI